MTPVLIIMSLPSPVPIKLKFSMARLEKSVSAIIESLPSPKKTLPELINFPWEMMDSLPLSVSIVPSLSMTPVLVIMSSPSGVSMAFKLSRARVGKSLSRMIESLPSILLYRKRPANLLKNISFFG
jgi:hypothetical protein